MWLEDLAQFVRTANVPEIGNKVTIFSMPGDDIAVMLTSSNSGMTADNELPGYFKGTFQLVVRSNSIRKTNDLADTLSALLSSHSRKTDNLNIQLALPTILVNYIYPRHLPVVFSRSDGAYYEGSVNFDICFSLVSG